MSVVYKPEDNKDKETTGLSGGQPAAFGAPASGGTPSAGGGGGSYTQPTTSGNFTNIQNFLKANQGSNLGGKLGGKIQGVADKAKEDIGRSQEQFNQQANQGRNQYNESLVGGALANPEEFAASNPNVANFQKLLKSQYGGPQEIQNAQQLGGQVQQAQNIAGLGSTEAGRFSLLRNFFNNNGQYSRGQQTLDNLILQGSPQEALKLQQSRSASGQAAQQLGQAQTAAQQAAQQYGQEAQATNAKTAVELQKAQQGVLDPLQQRVVQEQQIEAQRQAVRDNLDRLLQGQTISGYGAQPQSPGALPGETQVNGITTSRGLEGQARTVGSGDLTPANAPEPVDQYQAVENALRYAADQKVFNTSDIQKVRDMAAKLNTPVDRLMVQRQGTTNNGIFGYGGASGGQTFTYDTTPLMSQLKLNELLRGALTSNAAQNITKEGLITDQEAARLGAYGKLGGYDPSVQKAQQGYQGGQLGFNLGQANSSIDKDLAQLRKESLIELPDTAGPSIPMYDQILRGIAPTTANEAIADVGKDVNGLTSGTIGGTLGGAAGLTSEIYRIPTGVAASIGKDDLNFAKNLAGDLKSGNIGGAAMDTINKPLPLQNYIKDTPVVGGLLAPTELSALQKNAAGQFSDYSQGNIFQGLGKTLSTPFVAPAAGFQKIGNVISQIPVVGGAVGAIGNAVGNVVNAINPFCYAAGTEIKMKNGKYQYVEDLKLGDELSLGGKVTARGEAFADGVCKYKDTVVSDSHAVFENGKFIRVGDSPLAQKIDKEEIVYPIETENHLLVTPTHVSADFSEVEGGTQMTPEQRLEKLNSQSDLLNLLNKYRMKVYE